MRFTAPLETRKIVRKKDKKFLWLIKYKGNEHLWQVITPFRFYYDDRDVTKYLEVPLDYVTDLASVPFPFDAIYPDDGDHDQAAVAHDWAYQNRGDVVWHDLGTGTPPKKGVPMTREEQDQMFKNGMKVLNVHPTKRFLFWKAVDGFGWVRYPKPKK